MNAALVLSGQSPWRMPEIVDHEQPVVAFCSEGFTSSLAAASLRGRGLRNATDLARGFRAWAAAGLPTEAA